MSTVRDCRLCTFGGPTTHVEDVVSGDGLETPVIEVECMWIASPSAHVPPWVDGHRHLVAPSTALRCVCYAPDPAKERPA